MTSPTDMVRGRRFSPVSIAGATMAPGPASPRRCWTNWTTRGLLTTTFGLLTARSSAPAELPLERKKKGAVARQLGGRKATQLQEPLDHALGRSRGGFGTKVHLVCESHGFILAIHVTAGQVHESKAFEPTMGRLLVHGHRGTNRWPSELGGDKGYSYPGIRRWCKKRRIQPVIPTRSNQPREEDFDKGTYRQRNIIERAVNWYKEYRALGTRYEKLAVNYVALWLVAIIDKALKHLYPDHA